MILPCESVRISSAPFLSIGGICTEKFKPYVKVRVGFTFHESLKNGCKWGRFVMECSGGGQRIRCQIGPGAATTTTEVLSTMPASCAYKLFQLPMLPEGRQLVVTGATAWYGLKIGVKLVPVLLTS